MALVPGSTAGSYRIIEPLGRGGMASVYRAYEAALDRYVALKVLPREFLHDPTFAERFRREAQVIARLEHPNIVPIYAFDIDRDEGLPWMAMRLVAGGALSQLLKQQRLPFPRSVEILRGVADALDYAHGRGIVHRDVKPQNVLLDEAGRVYLADFGIAKILEASGGLTATGMITGTPQYMAPEQATATKVGRHADVYALGIVAYEMFTGRVPFAADTPVAVLMKHVQEPLPIPPADTLPEPLLRPLLKCTAKKAEERWDTAGAFVSALEAALGARTTTVAAAVQATRPQGATVSVPTAASRPTAASPATARPAPRVSVPVPAMAAPEPVLVEPSPAPARLGRTGVLLAGAAGFVVLVSIAIAVVGYLVLRGQGEPVATPSPRSVSVTTLAPSATPAPRPTVSPEGPGPAVPATTRPARSPSATPAAPLPTPAPAAPLVDPRVAELTAALGQGDPGARWRAAQALGTLRADAAPAVPSLAAALADSSAEVRWRAAEALGLIGRPARPAVPAIARALADSDPLVRTEATKALGLLGQSAAEAVPALAGELTAADVSIRREAARALGRIGGGSAGAVGALMLALRDKDKFVRMESARALGRVGPPAREAIAALDAAGRDPDLLVSREAQAALAAIGR